MKFTVSVYATATAFYEVEADSHAEAVATWSSGRQLSMVPAAPAQVISVRRWEER